MAGGKHILAASLQFVYIQSHVDNVFQPPPFPYCSVSSRIWSNLQFLYFLQGLEGRLVVQFAWTYIKPVTSHPVCLKPGKWRRYDKYVT